MRPLRARARSAPAMGAAGRRRHLAERQRGATARGRAPLRRGARARARVARGVAPRVPRLRTASDDLRHSFAQSVADLAALRMRDRRRHRDAARRRHALVHDRLRPRHADHEPADDAARPRARDRLAGGARGAPGDARTTRRSTPSRARSSTSCGAGGRPRRGSAPTTAPSTRRRSTSSCSRRSGAGRPTPSCVERLREPALAALGWIDRVRRP